MTLVSIETKYGRTHFVRQEDLDSGLDPIPAFHKDGTPLLSGRKGLGGQWMVGRRSLKGGAA
jgi:hypothetical protein